MFFGVRSGSANALRVAKRAHILIIANNQRNRGQLVSLVQTSFGSALPALTRVRRIVMVSSEGTEEFKTLCTAGYVGRIEVVRHVRLSDNVCHDSLRAILSPETLRREGVSRVVIANRDHSRLAPVLLEAFQSDGIKFLSESRFIEEDARCVDIDNGDLSEALFHPGPFEEIRKRIFDVLLATAMLILGVPLMLLVALLIRLDSKGPVMYRQERVGLRGRTFILYKFRSMHQNAEADGAPQWATIGDPRITRVGKFIRYTRIDELPQLLNVLRGDMSLIGPRPERPYFVQQLSAAIPLYSLRHTVKPGITGWAQVKASYGASIEDGREKLRYDLYYLKHRGMRLDLMILLRTLRVVVLQEGAR